MRVSNEPVRGIDVDTQARCAHYHSTLDIVAIRMKCCGLFYACKDCHEALASHAVEVWPAHEWDARAVLCGACGTELTIRQYLNCDHVCPACGTSFNPACREHRRHYFEMEAGL